MAQMPVYNGISKITGGSGGTPPHLVRRGRPNLRRFLCGGLGPSTAFDKLHKLVLSCGHSDRRTRLPRALRSEATG
tara:strand:- start:939 stop:1166 length:228 start_codon:yes stop_codon:yes gene_type:complete